MSRFIVLWVVLGTALVPLLAARDPDPVRGLRKALTYGLAFFALYLVGLLVIYPRV